MKWITHQTAAVAAALALHLPLEGVAAACVGAVLPDVLDQRVAGLAGGKKTRQKVFNAIHRGTTHWFGWWLALLLAALVASAPALPPAWRGVPPGLGLGGLSHVLLDMLTPAGVPLLPFSRKSRISLHLCATGSLGEYCFLACAAGAVWLLKGEDLLRLARQLGRGWLF